MDTLKCKECELVFETLDSLRRHRVQKHKVNAEQTYIDYILDGVNPICKCGCGERPKFLGIDTGFRDYKLGHASRVNNNWGHNKTALSKSHETQRKMYCDGSLIIWNKGLNVSDERVKANVDKIMSNPTRGVKISKSLSGVPKSKIHKDKLSKQGKLRWLNPDEREKQSHRRMEYIIKNGFQVKSKLEETFIKILEQIDLIEDRDFHRQHYVRSIKALFDFKLSGKKILIEVDGDYWHCNPNSQWKEPLYEAQKSNLIQDKIKENWCQENGFKLLRFWESDINNKPEEVITRLIQELGI